ncbi:AraC family transcriptional regulator [Cupriavidus consociatus]|uniref:AraC family transcriptional regulator n=1 Tax=Cupriavidus consociatus TaxID=2821357 RepID=UPI001AE6BD28|nr:MULTISPECIES: AraC family transcriptional regulator [unclassified Cupriavidus]MBP0623113.1 AraC family transcriptional regulator [Cupriavidus sp. LEh25]MDK2659805.1 AraC family transcriptional regulator [Cupriavidus sp. LEh21]
MDPLSDVFHLLKVESVLSARLEVHGAWSLRFSAYEHIKFGSVLEGAFWLWFEDGAPPVELRAGDFYLLTQGQAYCTGSDPSLPPVDGREVLAESRCADGIVRYGRSGEKVSAAGGRFVFDADTGELLLKSLPRLIHIPAASETAPALRAVLDLLRLETGTPRPGASVAAASLANMVLVQVLREYLASGVHTPGWLGALADPKIGTALALIHEDVARRWKVDELAAAVAMSRTTFAERFRTLVGMTPIDYLTDWRIAKAGAALREGKSIASVAESIGYGSEAAFNSAFKRIVGQTPGRYRQSQSAA